MRSGAGSLTAASLSLAFLLSAASATFAVDAPVATASDDLVFRSPGAFASPQDMQLNDVARADVRLVAVGERGVIVLSDDNGSSWSQAQVPVSATLTAVTFVDDRLGWAVGHAGVILHSEDAGSTWQLQFDGNRANAAYLEYAQAKQQQLEVDVAALEAQGRPEDAELLDDMAYALEDAVFASEDAQDALATGPVDPFLDVLFVNESVGYAVGAYGMLYSTDDGGAQWQLAIDGIDNVDRFHYYSIAASNATTLFLSGEAGLLYVSNDSGTTWQRIPDLYEGSLFGVVVAADDVMTFGLRGNNFVTSDVGASWQRRETNQSYSLYGGSLLGDGRTALVGAGGSVLLLDESGQIEKYSHPSRSTFSSVVQASDGSVVLVGMDGVGRLDEAEQLQ
ncbi:MAG: YCF48-related protein [Halioglobus sp.]